ncbi:PKD domain-containing protein, partial [Patescibacteria group bacterium]|nr:PKD domain-containing protein [Patescibacteria group bacterium]
IKNMKKKNTILLLIFLLVAMAGGLLLVKQSQETRRGAAFASTSLMVLPSEKIVKNVGDVVSAKVYYQTESEAKVDGVQTVVCYGDELSLDEDTGVVANTDNGFEETPIVAIKDAGNGTWCATVVATSKKSADKLKTVGEAFTLSFSAIKEGSGEITLNKEKSMVTGDNSASATDKMITVTSVDNTTYEIGGGGGGDVPTCAQNTLNPGGGIAPYSTTFSGSGNAGGSPGIDGYRWDFEGDGEWDSTMISTGNVAIGPVNHTYTTPGTYRPKYQVHGSNGTWSSTCDYGFNVMVTTGDEPILNFKVSFGNVRAADMKCGLNWPLQVIVLSGGDSKAYTEITASKVGENNSLAVFEGSLPLVGFSHLDNVAVFIKGPKHLQMKYAVQNQNKAYDQAGGQLVLTKDQSTSTVYDFSGYPMIPGDVVGANTEVQDGWINGVDFASVKAKALTHESVADGEYLKADLDANCQVNSNDVNVLKISLQTKQGQLY